MSDFPATSAERRAAEIAQVLSRAVRHQEADAADALRIIRHELRRLSTARKLGIPTRSVGAQTVIDRYGVAALPKAGAPDALHADHVHPLTARVLRETKGVEAWARELARLSIVVCVTGRERDALRAIERTGVTGPAKYAPAGIAFIGAEVPWATGPAPLVAA